MPSAQTLPVPLRADRSGALRVAGTRVLLESVVASFDAGATAEEIAQQFPTVGLPEIYAVLSYVLANRAEVDAYLESRAEASAEIRRQLEARHSPAGIRERLAARRRLG